ncbi:MAG: hypothetical protein KIT31_31850 [Deltaproteobacteria bacterium]|nr:hypothetical protein [Deltaproteobacteria bacterium]
MSLVSLLGACAVDSDLDGDPTDLDVTATPKLATNALMPAYVWQAQPTFNPAKLDAANLGAMAQTDEGRVSLVYLVGCALNAGHNVSTTVGGVSYTFAGAVGVADTWTSSALSLGAQRWVSACVLARLNETGQQITISLRGSSTSLGLSGTEGSLYDEQEGAFFGNVFPGRDFYVASCRGTGAIHWSRTCATATGNCGMEWRGECANVCSSSGGNMTACVGSNGTTYGEPITTYLDL